MDGASAMQEDQATPLTQWHKLFGALLEALLIPVGISVNTSFPIMANSPEVDVLLLRREDVDEWTDEQYALLPDGVRHTSAKHVLLEFKYTESINLSALQQAIGYDYFYRRSNHLKVRDVQTFIIGSKHPNGRFMQEFGYQPTKWAGVYHSQQPILKSLPLISLNKLGNAENNAFIKCFASRKKEKLHAFDTLHDENSTNLSSKLRWYVANLWRHWFNPEEGESDMNIQVSQKNFEKMIDMWGDQLLATMPPEDILSRYTPEYILSRYTPEDILSRYTPEDRLAGLAPQDRLAGLTSEDLAEIEAYLLQRKQQNSDD